MFTLRYNLAQAMTIHDYVMTSLFSVMGLALVIVFSASGPYSVICTQEFKYCYSMELID